MNYKIIVLTFLFAVFISGISLSQGKEPVCRMRSEKIKAQKVAFITEKLDLTSEEAQIFWPVYNEYEKEKEKLYDEKRKLMKNIMRNFEILKDADIEIAADKLLELDVSDAKFRQQYYEKFKTVLPIRKVVKLQQSEHDFKHYLLKQIRGHQRSERGQGYGKRY